MTIMKQLEHPNIVRFHEAVDDGSFIFMGPRPRSSPRAPATPWPPHSYTPPRCTLRPRRAVLEFVDGGQLMRFDASRRRYKPAECLHDLAAREEADYRRGGRLPDTLLRRLFAGLVDAIDYLHTHCVAHRDIKPENVLVTKQGTCKLADFGCALSFPDDDANGHPSVSNTRGTPHFFAPECVSGAPYDPFAVDAWALGATLHALALGTLVVDGTDSDAVFGALENYTCAAARQPSFVAASMQHDTPLHGARGAASRPCLPTSPATSPPSCVASCIATPRTGFPSRTPWHTRGCVRTGSAGARAARPEPSPSPPATSAPCSPRGPSPSRCGGGITCAGPFPAPHPPPWS